MQSICWTYDRLSQMSRSRQKASHFNSILRPACIEVDNKQTALPQADSIARWKLNEHWQALISKYYTSITTFLKEMLREHLDFFSFKRIPLKSALWRGAAKFPSFGHRSLHRRAGIGCICKFKIEPTRSRVLRLICKERPITMLMLLGSKPAS